MAGLKGQAEEEAARHASELEGVKEGMRQAVDQLRPESGKTATRHKEERQALLEQMKTWEMVNDELTATKAQLDGLLLQRRTATSKALAHAEAEAKRAD